MVLGQLDISPGSEGSSRENDCTFGLPCAKGIFPWRWAWTLCGCSWAYPSKECEVGLGEQISTRFLTLFEVVDIGGPDAGVTPDGSYRIGQAGTDLSVKGSPFMIL